MKIAYVDLAGGASGDMLLGALLDAGLPMEELRAGLASLGIGGWSFEAKQVMRGAIAATQAIVHVDEHAHDHGHAHDHAHDHPHPHAHPHAPGEVTRTPGELIAILERSSLPPRVVARSSRIIRRIAEAEASIHDQPVETVHLHEIGALDTLVDVAGVVLGFEILGIERIHVSRFPLAHGTVMSRHGPLPLPAPATLALLAGAPVRVVPDLEAELVTPTGAAILTTLADGFGDCPPMVLRRVGQGAGSRELPIPNLLRLWIGDADGAAGAPGSDSSLIAETLVALECNIDDMPGERFGFVMERLLAEGALDVTLTPVQMKKNRPGTRLWALARPADATRLAELMLRETTTLGVRRAELLRVSLPRELVSVATRFGEVRVKIARLGAHTKFDPEFEDLRRLALAAGVPLGEVESAALEAARALKPSS